MTAEAKESANQIPTFSQFMGEFLTEKGVKTVVEVGADVGLRLALRLSPYCDRYVCVNFIKDTIRMRGWYEMLGMINVEIIGGDALELSRLIPEADIIILHNVLLDSNKGKDTDLMWEYRRGEIEYSPEEKEELNLRFGQAKEDGYKEFLKVANPGYIVTFRRPDTNNTFRDFLIDRLKINPNRLERKELLSDECEETWQAFIIDNT